MVGSVRQARCRRNAGIHAKWHNIYSPTKSDDHASSSVRHGQSSPCELVPGSPPYNGCDWSSQLVCQLKGMNAALHTPNLWVSWRRRVPSPASLFYLVRLTSSCAHLTGLSCRQYLTFHLFPNRWVAPPSNQPARSKRSSQEPKNDPKLILFGLLRHHRRHTACSEVIHKSVRLCNKMVLLSSILYFTANRQFTYSWPILASII